MTSECCWLLVSKKKKRRNKLIGTSYRAQNSAYLGSHFPHSALKPNPRNTIAAPTPQKVCEKLGTATLKNKKQYQKPTNKIPTKTRAYSISSTSSKGVTIENQELL